MNVSSLESSVVSLLDTLGNLTTKMEAITTKVDDNAAKSKANEDAIAGIEAKDKKLGKGRSSNYVVVTLGITGGVRHFFHAPEGGQGFLYCSWRRGGQHFFPKFYNGAKLVLNNTSI